MRILDKKRIDDCFLITLDDGRQIEVFDDVYYNFKLYSYDEISEELIKSITFECDLLKAKRQLMIYISKYPYRSESFYKNYLIKKGFDLATAKKAVAHFVENGYIDELEAAERFIKRYENKKSSSYIKNLLIRNGFKTDIIKMLKFDKLKESDQIILEKLVRKKLRNLDANDKKEIKKTIIYLLKKGYDYNSIMEKIEEILKY